MASFLDEEIEVTAVLGITMDGREKLAFQEANITNATQTSAGTNVKAVTLNVLSLITRGVAVVVYGISISTHRQQLLRRLHVTEVGGQAQRRITRIRPDLEGCLIYFGHNDDGRM